MRATRCCSSRKVRLGGRSLGFETQPVVSVPMPFHCHPCPARSQPLYDRKAKGWEPDETGWRKAAQLTETHATKRSLCSVLDSASDQCIRHGHAWGRSSPRGLCRLSTSHLKIRNPKYSSTGTFSSADRLLKNILNFEGFQVFRLGIFSLFFFFVFVF